MDNNNNIYDTVIYIYQYIVTHWDDIKNDANVMNVLDINNNNMCKYYKSMNPELNDTDIQARTLTFLFSMIFVLSTIQTLDNNILDISYID
jgi:hypothetical protein